MEPIANMKNLGTATISGDLEVDRAIATLVLAFETDPVARWMYHARDQYLLHIPRLFRALGADSFEVGAAHSLSDGAGIAIWLPPGVQGDGAPVEAVIADGLTRDMQRRGVRDDGALSADRAALVPVADRCRRFAAKQGIWSGSPRARSSAMR